MAKKTSARQEMERSKPAVTALTQSAPEFVEREHELLRLLRKVLTQQNQFIDKLSKRRFKTFLDSLPSLIVSLGADQRVRLCNKRFAAFLGLTARQTIGKPFWHTLSIDYDLMRPHLVNGLNGREDAFEQSLHGKQDRYFHVTITPDFESAGAVNGIFISLLDITDRKALEEKQRRNEKRFRVLARERADLLKRVQDAGRTKDNFLATLSHELRTPLTSIMAWAVLIQSGSLSPERIAEGMASIERNARSQARLIEELLDISRIASGKMPFEASVLNMDDLVKQTVDSLLPAFGEKNVQIELKACDNISLVRGDRERLQQVIMNLLSNALKFTPAEGQVHVEVTRTAAHVQIEVQDNGQGIPQSFLPYVFDEFRQAEMSSVRKKGGLGLGLSIARRIVELHQGSILASSPGPGKGARFAVTLPVVPA